MPVDERALFAQNPSAFIATSPIALNAIAESMGGGFPAVNNQRSRFTLTRGVGAAPVTPADLPMLRMQPATVGVGALVGGMATLDAYYCHAGSGGMAFGALWYVDIPAAPGAADALFLFTTGMNGCTLVVASVVPAGAPALAANHWRVMHDHDHRPLSAWAAAGYTLRFAAYADSAEPGPVPAGWTLMPRCYNPHNYPWQYPAPSNPPVRVVTNFFWWESARWNCGSRHFHAAGRVATDLDAPPGVLPAQRSTQVWVV